MATLYTSPDRGCGNYGVDPHTPFFAVDVGLVEKRSEQLRCTSATRLYSVKAFAQQAVLEVVGKGVDGFSVCSLFEASLVRESWPQAGPIHFTSPGLSDRTAADIAQICTHVSFNSISQFNRLEPLVRGLASLGIRVNPGASSVSDARHDPCRPHSKLGASLREVVLQWESGTLQAISGIHVHNACFSKSWHPLSKTVAMIEGALGHMLHHVDWINLGGGHLWDDATDFSPLQKVVEHLTTKYDLEVFVEPGAGIVKSAGRLVASVVDLFNRDGKTIAVLDTTVNHLPEVFEYQYEPDLIEHIDGAAYKYILAGCSCLAGDTFGEYALEKPLEIGSRVTFTNVGAYSMVKANMFNGINFPSVCLLHGDGQLELVREFTYEDFMSRCGELPRI